MSSLICSPHYERDPMSEASQMSRNLRLESPETCQKKSNKILLILYSQVSVQSNCHQRCFLQQQIVANAETPRTNIRQIESPNWRPILGSVAQNSRVHKKGGGRILRVRVSNDVSRTWPTESVNQGSGEHTDTEAVITKVSWVYIKFFDYFLFVSLGSLWDP